MATTGEPRTSVPRYPPGQPLPGPVRRGKMSLEDFCQKHPDSTKCGGAGRGTGTGPGGSTGTGGSSGGSGTTPTSPPSQFDTLADLFERIFGPGVTQAPETTPTSGDLLVGGTGGGGPNQGLVIAGLLVVAGVIYFVFFRKKGGESASQ